MAKVIKGAFPAKKSLKSKAESKPIPSYVLHISIMFSEPLIWRRVQVPGNITLSTFHKVIQHAMGWSDSHVHQFLVGKISFEPTFGSGTIRETKEYDEGNYKLYELETGMPFMFSYLYDAGDGWEHEVRLEEVVPPTKKLLFPILLSGSGACPPESISDIHEYQSLLAELEKSTKGSLQSLAELTGISSFDPDHFDLIAAKDRLKDFFSNQHGWTK